MLIEFSIPRKSFLTKLTFRWLLLRMHTLMFNQVSLSTKSFVTEVTFICFSPVCVRTQLIKLPFHENFLTHFLTQSFATHIARHQQWKLRILQLFSKMSYKFFEFPFWSGPKQRSLDFLGGSSRFGPLQYWVERFSPPPFFGASSRAWRLSTLLSPKAT